MEAKILEGEKDFSVTGFPHNTKEKLWETVPWKTVAVNGEISNTLPSCHVKMPMGNPPCNMYKIGMYLCSSYWLVESRFNFDSQILWHLTSTKFGRAYAFWSHAHFPFKTSKPSVTLQNTRNIDHRLASHNIWKATAGHSHRRTQQLTNQHLGCRVRFRLMQKVEGTWPKWTTSST